MLGKLYVVATPIGNLGDISERAIKTLKEVDLIYAEDTRVTNKLLDHFEIDNHALSYHQHSHDSKKDEILLRLLAGESIALVSDAGTPGISDPGNELIDYVISKSELEIIPVPGPSAGITALSVCGFDVNKYIFIGFMPKKKRLKLLKFLNDSRLTFVFYESPHRIIKTLKVIRENLGERRVFVARELTKMHETLYRGEIDKVIKDLQASTLKGEITVVVEKPL
ncbi:MAG: Ribosomal RNA small subunit methyltransferase I [Candidatus Woesebacteria bacterium GW2011_GWB1_43_14]|uniref:Ribosomal RNA small subunit methyltransferase I n=1 Tax=Candidatus Woesebacteria bacterium GW2011_GWB1_43_14 TaxID=1618578 RepID=A0A0G1DGT0_9BACT|nr:MAG: Ribosomal RNA small subunit methyltransferase I [Candidatus Woesebacteria bacterium GW2011_GWC1_42_9]KKS96899.1 MAG: Ribosomal RNA small subunit methyltransferase I [Candidatus Woesebacteria bacterium GW2011_GWB1_43_14]